MMVPESLFRNILEISLPISAVIGLLLLLRPLLQKHYRAKWMYWVWLLLAVRLVVPVSFSLPVAPIVVSNPGMTIYQRDTNRSLPGNSDFVLLTPEKHAEAVQQEAARVSTVTNPTVETVKNEYRPVISLSQLVALVWGAGFCAVLLWEGVSYARFRRRVRRWRSVEEDGAVLARFEELKAELGVKKLTLARCSAISSPMVTGFIHPTLLLPERRGQAPALQGEAMEAVLRHELVHAKRHDLWYKLLLVFTRAAHWFNPLVWLMERQAGQDLEISCDEAVISGRDESFRAGYGRAILDAVDCGGDRERAPLTTYFHGGKKAMLERLQSIVNTRGRRRGAIALVLVLALAVSASAVCVINPPMQKVDGGSYTITLPADVTVKLTEEMPEGFKTSYYRAEFFRDGFVGSAQLLHIPSFTDMDFKTRVATYRSLDNAFDGYSYFDSYVSPGNLWGIRGESFEKQNYYLPTSGNQVLVLSFLSSHFTPAEIEAVLSSLMVGSIPTSNPKGDFTLTVDFTEDEAVWHLWDTSRSPKLLGTANVPARYRIWAEPLWSEDGRWAAVPSGDGGLRWNWRIFGVGKEGFTQNVPIVLAPSMLSQAYTPIPETLELRAMKFVNSRADYPALAFSYSLLDTEGSLQSGTLNYNCMPPEVSTALTGYTPTTDITQNTPLVPTQWADEIHAFSMPLPEGTVISPTDGTEAQIFATPDDEELGRIYKTAERPSFNSGGVRIEDGGATYMYSWWDSSHSLYYHLELRQSDNAIPLTQRMADALTMDGKSVEHFSDADSSRGAYTQADVDSAMEAARAYFAERDDVRLDKLWFDPEKLEMIEGSYPRRGVRTRAEIEGMMVLLCDYSYIGELPAAAPGREMTDWMLVFVRDSADAPWVLDNEGY